MELYCWETHHIVPQFLACKNRQLELWMDMGIEFHVEIYLRNHKFTTNFAFYITIYVIFLMFVVQNKNFFSTNIEIQNMGSRQRNNLYLPQANLTIYQKVAYYLGIKIFNNLHLEIKNVTGNQKKFKIALKKFLYTYSFYTMEEYLSQALIMYHATKFLIILVLVLRFCLYTLHKYSLIV